MSQLLEENCTQCTLCLRCVFNSVVPCRATRALHFSGGDSLEGAITWLTEHEEDAGLDEPLLVPKVCLLSHLHASVSLASACVLQVQEHVLPWCPPPLLLFVQSARNAVCVRHNQNLRTTVIKLGSPPPCQTYAYRLCSPDALLDPLVSCLCARIPSRCHAVVHQQHIRQPMLPMLWISTWSSNNINSSSLYQLMSMLTFQSAPADRTKEEAYA